MSMYDNLPKDPVILLSFTNTQLRDTFKTLDSFCYNFNISKEDLCAKLSLLPYEYDSKTNQFI